MALDMFGLLFISLKTFNLAAHVKTGYALAAGSSKLPIVQVVHVPKRDSTAPAVGEEVVIMKSKPKILNAPAIPTGCIVDSESDEEAPTTTSLASKLLTKLLPPHH